MVPSYRSDPILCDKDEKCLSNIGKGCSDATFSSFIVLRLSAHPEKKSPPVI